MKDSLSAKPQRATSDVEYADGSKESQGWQYPEILLPFEEEQAELLIIYVVHHRILDTSQLPPLRKLPRITINMECCKE
ncbi:hypothetical protein Tco_0116917 [Tanacetum coccineum]